MTGKLIHQAKQVVSGTRTIPDRIVSFFDPQARPIKKGKLAKGTGFRYKVRVDETESGFVTGYAVYGGKKSQARTEYENQLWFKDLQRYRAAGEAKISLLKRKYGLGRSRYRGLSGSKSWVGFGILTHNLDRVAKMLAKAAR